MIQLAPSSPQAYVEVPELNELITGMALQFYRHRRGDRKPKPAQLKSLVSYLLSELPTITHGIQVDGLRVDTVVYPAAAGAGAAYDAVGGGGPTGIVAIWDMMAQLRASEGCKHIFTQLDAIAAGDSGQPAAGSETGLRTVAIDALFPPRASQMMKSASAVDLVALTL